MSGLSLPLAVQVVRHQVDEVQVAADIRSLSSPDNARWAILALPAVPDRSPSHIKSTNYRQGRGAAEIGIGCATVYSCRANP